MSKPLVALSLTSKPGDDGRYRYGLTDAVVVRVTSSSSGDVTPLVSYHVEWGDGFSKTTDFKPVGQHQFEHEYEDEGPFVVSVKTANLSGESSTEIVNLVITRRESIVTPVNTWRGISTPGTSFQESNKAQSSVYPPFSARLVAPAAKDAKEVYLSSVERIQDGDALTITEVGKLLSYVIVSYFSNGTAKLFGELNDSYSTDANVEVQKPGSARITGEVTGSTEPWNFPSTSGREVVKASLRTLLNTRVGERVMRPDVGNSLHLIPFEPNDIVTRDQVRTEVSRVFRQEPRAVVEGVEITSDNNAIGVKVSASVVNEQSEFVLEVAALS